MQNREIYFNWKILDATSLQRVKVECQCGEIREMRAWNIRNGSPRMCRSCYHNNKIQNSLLPIGTTLYDWTVVSFRYEHKNSKTGGLKQHVRCKCGYECFLELSPLKSGRTQSCLSCASKKRRKYFKDIPAAYLRQILEGADKRSYLFEVSNEEVWSIFTQQNGKCALSGVDIDFKTKTASLDRIDSTKGYIPGNVQWVHKVVNQMKSNRTDEEFINWCKIITKHNQK